MRVEGYRKFCNKIFNATKFAMLKLDEQFVPEPVARPTGNESLVERWILDKLNFAADKLNRELERRDFFEATIAVHNFWLYELCDVYIVRRQGRVLLTETLMHAIAGSNEGDDR